MVLTQTLGKKGKDAVVLDEAKEVIRNVESENQAIRAAVLAKVAASMKPKPEEKREEALLEVMNENPSFENAVSSALFKLLRQFR